MSREREKELQLYPVNLRGERWFYLTDKRSGSGEACSFHTKEGHAHGFPVTAILRALQARGLLRRWDTKQQILRKAKP